MALVFRAPARSDAVIAELKAFRSAHYISEFHNCNYPPWFSTNELVRALNQRRVVCAYENNTLVGVLEFVENGDGEWQCSAGFVSDRSRSAEIGRGILQYVARTKTVFVPELPSHLRAEAESDGFHSVGGRWVIR